MRLLYLIIILFITNCSSNENERKQNPKTPKILHEAQNSVGNDISIPDTVSPLMLDTTSKISDGHYCYSIKTDDLEESFQFDLTNNLIIGTGTGDMPHEGIYWDMTYTGKLVGSNKAELTVTFFPEGDEGETTQEEWMVYTDSLRITSGDRGKVGPYFFLKCINK